MDAVSNSEHVRAPGAGVISEAAFAELAEAKRPDLHAHCYRMLGSLHDADDALQETLLRAWRSLPEFQGRSSLGTWIYRIATNVCLDALRRRPKRVLPIDYGRGERGGDDDETSASRVWIGPYPDEAVGVAEGPAAPGSRYERREALELAFVAMLQHLPPRQRAVLILRDVLGFSAREAAEALRASVPSVNGALLRARKTVEARLPGVSQQVALRNLGDARIRVLAERFADAFERGDVAAILSLLTDDAVFAMPPDPHVSRGPEEISRSWLMPEGPDPGLRYVTTRANGQLAVGAYKRERRGGRYLPLVLDVLTLRGELISEIHAFRSRELFERFGLPLELPAGAPRTQLEAEW